MVARADPSGHYGWLPPARPGDVTVALEDMARVDMADRQPLDFDRLQSWEERSAAEHRIGELLEAIGGHPAVRAIEQGGFSLYEFAEYRLRPEIVRCLRGWTLARAATNGGAGAWELVCDPALPAALLMGVRAGLGLDSRPVPYVLPPALPGSPGRRELARQLMRAVAAASRPRRGSVRVAVVAAGKLSLALASLSDADLRAAGVGLMPFPGLDHGNGLVLALRRRLPLLGSYGPLRRGVGIRTSLPTRLDLEGDPELDSTFALLVSRVLAGAAPELDQAVAALGGLSRARSLRALLLPSGAYGASRLLIEWARERGVQVGVIQHGIYGFREFDGGDRRADVIFGWGEGTTEQTSVWRSPRPRVRIVGVPGLRAREPSMRASAADWKLRRALITAAGPTETPISQLRTCDAFMDALWPSIARLTEAGVEVALRPHPTEAPEYYRRLLRARGLEVKVTAEGTFQAAVADADILISSTSSVAFEAATQGVPVLLWMGSAPRWLREEHLVAPWGESLPGMYQTADELLPLVEDLIERPAEGLRVPRELGRHLARYAAPFDPSRFAAALRELGS